LLAADAAVKEHGRLAAMSAHSSPTKLQPTVAMATVTSASSSASMLRLKLLSVRVKFLTHSIKRLFQPIIRYHTLELIAQISYSQME